MGFPSCDERDDLKIPGPLEGVFAGSKYRLINWYQKRWNGNAVPHVEERHNLFKYLGECRN